MWEITINISNANYNYLENIKSTLNKLKCKPIMAINIGKSNIASLSIAVEDNNKEIVQNKLFSILPEIIVYSEKERFLINNYNFNSLIEPFKTAILKVLVLFDIESDIEYVKATLSIDKNINIPSFFQFKLKELKDRWMLLVEIAERYKLDNATSDMLLDFIKLFFDSIKPNLNYVLIKKNNNKFLFYTKSNKSIKNIFFDVKDEEELLAGLIVLAPKNIELHNLELSDQTLKLLKLVFNGKVRQS